ncbi:ERCC4 domain-containing protein [Mycena kentingensis (nom. inval.)]|nr:ERCC4 domain-containing protein [Mycena kentingensis (nom. inval.)]
MLSPSYPSTPPRTSKRPAPNSDPNPRSRKHKTARTQSSSSLGEASSSKPGFGSAGAPPSAARAVEPSPSKILAALKARDELRSPKSPAPLTKPSQRYAHPGTPLTAPTTPETPSSRAAAGPSRLPVESLPLPMTPLRPSTFRAAGASSPLVLKAGTYTIHMAVDYRECKGNGRTSGRTLHDELQLASTTAPHPRITTMPLELGDIIWVADDGAGAHYVLDVILERKRLDDLVNGICNRRFREQKFRLRRSGISRVVYVLEEHPSASECRKLRAHWGADIRDAISEVQVVDEFVLKQTRTLRETAEYIAALTREIVQQHQTKDLYVVPTAQINRFSYLETLTTLRETHPQRTYVTSLADFAAINSKSAHLTVGDTWGRMLKCVHGMSGEKVGAVVAQWPTPRLFMEALKDAGAEERAARAEAIAGSKRRTKIREARMMLKGVSAAEGGVRSIGTVLSGKVCDLFLAKKYSDGVESVSV